MNDLHSSSTVSSRTEHAPYHGPRRGAAARELVSYLKEFGLGLDSLRPDQTAMFLAARNAAGEVEELEIPVARQAWEERGTALSERETDRAIELPSHGDEWLGSRLPADDMDVALTRSVEDLSRIFPSQWLLEELMPEAFYARLAQGELLMPEWQRPDPSRTDLLEERQDRELVDERAAADAARQHAYVLLDTSRTMNDHDRRGTVARGLALAFLHKGFTQGARLHLRPFTAKVGELSSGSGREDFHRIARRIIELPNAGQTRIQAALEQAVQDIRRAGPCRHASIMLITDGISRLSANPLAGEKLHTFLLGDLFDQEAAPGTVRTLKEWSTTFHRVWTNRFGEILAPTVSDCWSAARSLEASLREWNGDPADAGADRLRRILDNARSLLRELKQTLGKSSPVPAEIEAIEEQLAEAERLLERISPEGSREEPGRPERGRVAGAGYLAVSGGDGDLSGPSGFWERIRQWAARIGGWIARIARHLFKE